MRQTISFYEFGSILSALCFSVHPAAHLFSSRWIYLHSSILSEFARSVFPSVSHFARFVLHFFAKEAPFPQREINNSGTLASCLRLCAQTCILSFCRQCRVILLRVWEWSMSLTLRRSIIVARKKEWTDNTLDNLSTRLLYSKEQCLIIENRFTAQLKVYFLTLRIYRQTKVLQTYKLSLSFLSVDIYMSHFGIYMYTHF